jgi:transcription initiation factor IIE alpha subunit
MCLTGSTEEQVTSLTAKVKELTASKKLLEQVAQEKTSEVESLSKSVEKHEKNINLICKALSSAQNSFSKQNDSLIRQVDVWVNHR